MDRILPLTPAISQQSAVFFFEGLDTPMQQEGDSWSFTGRAQNPFHQAVGMKTIQQKSHSRAKVFSALASVNLGLHAVALKGSTMKVKWVECCLELMLFGWKWGRHAHDPAELMDMPKGKEFAKDDAEAGRLVILVTALQNCHRLHALHVLLEASVLKPLNLDSKVGQIASSGRTGRRGGSAKLSCWPLHNLRTIKNR